MNNPWKFRFWCLNTPWILYPQTSTDSELLLSPSSRGNTALQRHYSTAMSPLLPRYVPGVGGPWGRGAVVYIDWCIIQFWIFATKQAFHAFAIVCQSHIVCFFKKVLQFLVSLRQLAPTFPCSGLFLLFRWFTQGCVFVEVEESQQFVSVEVEDELSNTMFTVPFWNDATCWITLTNNECDALALSIPIVSSVRSINAAFFGLPGSTWST